MIRSSKVSLKFSNPGKLEDLRKLIQEYNRVLTQFIDLLWPLEKVPTLMNKELTTQIASWLSARMLQCCGKQAAAIVRGTKRKYNQRQYVINKLVADRHTDEVNNLKEIQAKHPITKPIISNTHPLELDARFVTLELESTNSFDGWLTLGSIGSKMKLELPFRRTKHLNELLAEGQLKGGIRLTEKSITLIIDLPDPPPAGGSKVLGIDIGLKTALSGSDGHQTRTDLHGHSLDSILQAMARKQRGSAASRRAQTHRKNFINWSVNQLNFKDVKQLNIENIRDLRLGRRSSKVLNSWTYTDIFAKLESKCERLGVPVVLVNPTYTSQRCSACGWTRKANRKGKMFRCSKCGFAADADLNAATNISLNLPRITKEERLRKISRLGFYWSPLGQESLVPDVQKIGDVFQCPK